MDVRGTAARLIQTMAEATEERKMGAEMVADLQSLDDASLLAFAVALDAINVEKPALCTMFTESMLTVAAERLKEIENSGDLREETEKITRDSLAIVGEELRGRGLLQTKEA